MKGKKPHAAFLLVLLGSIATVFGSARLLLYNPAGVVGGAIGILAGLTMLVAAFMLYSDNTAVVKKWSSAALIASFISTAAFYNVYLGFAFTLIGSLLGLAYMDDINALDVFIFVLIGGIALFIGSIFLVGASHALPVIETGLLGTFLSILIIKYSTQLYSTGLDRLQKFSFLTLSLGVLSIFVDMLAVSLSPGAVLSVGITSGTMLVIAGSFSGTVRPNLIANQPVPSQLPKSGKRRRR